MRISNPPVARDLMVTARSFGNYDLAAALADLIDNSVKARASSIEINFIPIPNDIIVRIRDNGEGMDRNTLINAMRPASSNPEASRDPDDLGRFGWGLKSASLSQARVLTVVSWQNSEFTAARWDIDNIEDWGMDIFEDVYARDFLNVPVSTQSGTEVIWSHTDRLVESNTTDLVTDSLSSIISHAINKLSLVFHRYLAGETGKKICINVNGNSLKPIDPFLVYHDATQTLDAEIITMAEGQSITVQPYVLPHFSKLTVEIQEQLGGAEGMIRNQGFYVYRNKRLIIYGTWFRLVPHSDLTQLTRIKVDLPNSVDANWRITVDKSDAQLPSVLKKRLQGVIRNFNKRSIKVHRNKGVSVDRDSSQVVWKRFVKNGQVKYVINRDHPLIHEFQNDSELGMKFDLIMRMLENYFPTDIFMKDSMEGVLYNAIDTSELNVLINQCLINYMQSSSEAKSLKDFISFISRVEPFESQIAYTESYIKKNLQGLFKE